MPPRGHLCPCNLGGMPEAIGSRASIACERRFIAKPLNPGNHQTCSTYSYDDLGRLTQVTCGTTWAQTFTYDAYGNIKKTAGNQMWTPTYDSANNNRYQTGGGISYDLNGNLLSDSFTPTPGTATGEIPPVSTATRWSMMLWDAGWRTQPRQARGNMFTDRVVRRYWHR
jgi:YD repeat-containing protein